PATPIYTTALHDALPISTFLTGWLTRESGRTEMADSTTVQSSGKKLRNSPFVKTLRDPTGFFGFLFVLLIVLAALLAPVIAPYRSEEHTSELQSRFDLVC